jgi:hypothetical protein
VCLCVCLCVLCVCVCVCFVHLLRVIRITQGSFTFNYVSSSGSSK